MSIISEIFTMYLIFSFILSLPAFYIMKKRKELNFHDVGVFFYSILLWILLIMNNFKINIKTLSNGFFEPIDISICIIILTYINIIKSKKFLTTKIKCIIALTITILVFFLMPTLPEWFLRIYSILS